MVQQRRKKEQDGAKWSIHRGEEPPSWTRAILSIADKENKEKLSRTVYSAFLPIRCHLLIVSQVEQRIQRLRRLMKKNTEGLQKAGITYEFPGFVSCIIHSHPPSDRL